MEIQVDCMKTGFIEVFVFETLKSTLHMLVKQIGVSHPIKKFIMSRVYESTDNLRMDGFVADTMCIHCCVWSGGVASHQLASFT